MSVSTSLTRDESWVRFNERVLQEALNKEVPLLERLKFLGIYSSNFDEFFRVRIARLRQYKLLKKADRVEYVEKPNQQLKQILNEVKRLQDEFEGVFFNDIVPSLREKGIDFVFLNQITKPQAQYAKTFFEKNVTQYLEFFPIRRTEEFPFLENHKIYYALHFADGTMALASLKENDIPRFVELPSENEQKAVIFNDDIIRAGLQAKFNKNQLLGCHVIKVSRDADFEIEDEFDGDLIEKLKIELEKRDEGQPTRLVYDKSISKTVLKTIRKGLGLKKTDLIPGGRYHNFSDFFGFPNLTNDNSLTYDEMPPLKHPYLENVDSIIDTIYNDDVLLSFPYQKFDYISKMINEAATRADITHIKMTLYRVSKKSSVANSLLLALQNGKKVTVFIEAKARFDEDNNLQWGARLEKAGAHVIYSYPGIKVHTKIMMIESSIEGKDLAYVGTGNFNEKTAKIYCDHSLITANQEIVSDIDMVFQLLEGKILVPKPKKLLVSPYNTRSKFIQLIDNEIKNHLKGKDSGIILKMNSLEDSELIEKLYEASTAGVKIQLIIRGFCCLTPGVTGLSENIEVISIIDRFLEHARVFYFKNDGNDLFYMGSADMMVRNLDHRVEVISPIEHPNLQAILKEILDIQLRDNTKARIIDAGQNNDFVQQLPNEENIRAQYATYAYFQLIEKEHIHN